LVMAGKKAVGAEYFYGQQYGLAKEKQQRVSNRKAQASSACVVVVCTLLFSCLFLMGLGYTFLKANLACLNWELQKIKQENMVIASEMEKTKLEIAGLKALDRVEQLAVTQLGMIKNPSIEYLVMHDAFAQKGNLTTDEAGLVAENKAVKGKGAVTENNTVAEKEADLFKKIYLLVAQATGERG